MTPEAKARVTIDALLASAGWHVCNVAQANIHAAVGVAIREFPLNPGFGYADYLLYVNGKACGVIEAKKEGATLTGVELQSSHYAKGLPTSLPAWSRPLLFVWESTGLEANVSGTKLQALPVPLSPLAEKIQIVAEVNAEVDAQPPARTGIATGDAQQLFQSTVSCRGFL